MNHKPRSRWAKRDASSDSVPKTAAEYRAWLDSETQKYIGVPLMSLWADPKQVISLWQRRGLELLNEERDRLAREADLEDW